MTECYYYIEQLPGVKLEDCYIRSMCTSCHWKNMTQEAWWYKGPFPACEIKCNICKKIIYDGRVEDMNAYTDE